MPAHGRAGWAAVALAVVIVAAPSALTGDGEAKRKRCRSSEARQTVSYRKGSRKRRATGCAPRFGSVPGAVAAALPESLSRLRAFALKLTPKQVKKLRRARAARKLLRASRATDAALGSRAAPVAQAASVTSGSDSRTVDGPPGTKSTAKGTGTDWRGSEPKIGRELKVVIDTKSTRLRDSDSRRSAGSTATSSPTSETTRASRRSTSPGPGRGRPRAAAGRAAAARRRAPPITR